MSQANSPEVEGTPAPEVGSGDGADTASVQDASVARRLRLATDTLAAAGLLLRLNDSIQTLGKGAAR